MRETFCWDDINEVTACSVHENAIRFVVLPTNACSTSWHLHLALCTIFYHLEAAVRSDGSAADALPSPPCVSSRYASRGQAAIWENEKLREWLVAKREKLRNMMKVQ